MASLGVRLQLSVKKGDVLTKRIIRATLLDKKTVPEGEFKNSPPLSHGFKCKMSFTKIK